MVEQKLELELRQKLESISNINSPFPPSYTALSPTPGPWPSRRSFGSLGLWSKSPFQNPAPSLKQIPLYPRTPPTSPRKSFKHSAACSHFLSSQDLQRVLPAALQFWGTEVTHVNTKIQEVSVAETPKMVSRTSFAVPKNSSYFPGPCNWALPVIGLFQDPVIQAFLYNVFNVRILALHQKEFIPLDSNKSSEL